MLCNYFNGKYFGFACLEQGNMKLTSFHVGKPGVDTVCESYVVF